MKRAAVTGLGAVSGLGLGVDALWQGLLRGESAPRRYPALAAAGLAVGPIAKVWLAGDGDAPESDDGAALLAGRAEARATELLRLAAHEALRDAGFSGRPPELRLGLAIGTTLGEKAPWVHGLRETWQGRDAPSAADFGAAAPAQALAAALAVDELRVVSTACASGNAALAVALGWLARGECDAVLAGGVDALQEFVLSGFVALRAHSAEPCKPFDATRSGLNLGEGAGLLFLEPAGQARAAGRRIRAFLAGAGLSCDAHHMTGPDREGRGAARAMRAALADAGLPTTAVDFVSAHGTATVFNDLMEARGLEQLLGERVRAVPVNSIKGAIGHTLGAAGALEAVMAVRALEEQLIPPTAGLREPDPAIPLRIVAGEPLRGPLSTVLSTSSGFGGVNAAVVLERAGSAGDETVGSSRPLGCAMAILAAGQLSPQKDEALAAHLGSRLVPGRGAQLLRMDRLCGLALAAVDLAVGGRERLGAHFGLAGEDVAIVVGSQYGCHRTDEDYYRSFRSGQPSPRLFAYTLPSSPVGEISIAYGITGPGLTVVSGRSAGLEALAEAERLLAAGQVRACLVVAAEVAAPTLVAGGETVCDGAVALLVARAEAGLAVPALGEVGSVACGYQHADTAAALERHLAELPDGAADAVLGNEGAGAVPALSAIAALLAEGPAAARIVSTEPSGLWATAGFRRLRNSGDM